MATDFERLAKGIGLVVNAAGFVLDARGDYVIFPGRHDFHSYAVVLRPADYKEYFDSAEGQQRVREFVREKWCPADIIGHFIRIDLWHGVVDLYLMQYDPALLKHVAARHPFTSDLKEAFAAAAIWLAEQERAAGSKVELKPKNPRCRWCGEPILSTDKDVALHASCAAALRRLLAEKEGE